jgi:hypothetical protein
MLGTVFNRLTFAIHASPQIKQISDLKGKTLATGSIGGDSYWFRKPITPIVHHSSTPSQHRNLK